MQSALCAEAAQSLSLWVITLVTLPVPRLTCVVVTRVTVKAWVSATASTMLFGSAISEGKLRPRETEPSHRADCSVGSPT